MSGSKYGIYSSPILLKPEQIALKSTTNGETASKTTNLKPSALVSFDHSGGFAAVHKTFERAMRDMPTQEANKLADLIEKSGLLKIKDVNKTNPHAADVFIDQFKLINGKDKHQAVYDDTTLPESFKPLMEFLKTKAVDAGRT
jgi:hypothetical protein